MATKRISQREARRLRKQVEALADPVSGELYQISSVWIGNEPTTTTMTLRLVTSDGRVRYVVVDTNRMTELSPKCSDCANKERRGGAQ